MKNLKLKEVSLYQSKKGKAAFYTTVPDANRTLEDVLNDFVIHPKDEYYIETDKGEKDKDHINVREDDRYF